jgi:hypothetical protein
MSIRIPPGHAQQHFYSQSYLVGEGIAGDPNVYNSPTLEEFIKDLGEIVFRDKAKRIFDWGAGPGIWIDYLAKYGHPATGIDYNPHSHPKVIQGDLLNWWDSTALPVPYTICTSVFMYRTLPEISRLILPRIYESFTEAAFLYTPDSPIQLYMDPTALSFMSAEWLQQICRRIGGFPVVLNFERMPSDQTGPSVLWLKEFDFERVYRIAELYREKLYRNFTVAL